MIKKNPKKNYSLKGKPLSTKIAFVVICAFIFSLFVGSFGGLFYLFKSCSGKPFTVSAETISGSTTSTTITCVLDVSSVAYEISDYYISTEVSNQYAQGSISRPLILRVLNDGILCHYFLDVYLYDKYEDVFNVHSLPLNDGLYVETSFAFTNFYGHEISPVDFAVDSNRFNTLGVPATVVVNSLAGAHEYITIEVTDVAGNSSSLDIYPSGALCSWYVHPFSNQAFSVTYYINPFDIGYIDRVADSKYKEGFDMAIIESEKFYDNVRQDAFDDGMQAGYNDAITKLNNYSFYHLMDAVTYAPLKVFISLFNFDFLGINVLSLVTFIISVIIVLGIVKFFL